MKEPHNYRKVGYSMIVISVSLTIIGLVVWAIGSNYHFASELMAGQEIDVMTPKKGYNIVSFDYTAPIGAKLKILDHADSVDETKKLQNQYQQSVKGVQILIFGNSRDDNVNLMANAEVAALTPTQGYNVLFFNHAMPVGAKLSMNRHDDLLVNATEDQQKQQKENKDKDVILIIFSSSYEDNLRTVLGSGSSVATATNAQPTTQSTPLAIPSSVTPVTNTSATTTNHGNESTIIPENVNTTATNANQTATIGSKKSVNLNEIVGITVK